MKVQGEDWKEGGEKGENYIINGVKCPQTLQKFPPHIWTVGEKLISKAWGSGSGGRIAQYIYNHAYIRHNVAILDGWSKLTSETQFGMFWIIQPMSFSHVAIRLSELLFWFLVVCPYIHTLNWLHIVDSAKWNTIQYKFTDSNIKHYFKH